MHQGFLMCAFMLNRKSALHGLKNKTILSMYCICYRARRKNVFKKMKQYQENISQAIKKNRFKGGGIYTGKKCMKINIIFIVIRKGLKKSNMLNLFFPFIFLLRWIKSNKFDLIHLSKNMESNLTLSINVKLKVTRIFQILISRVID